MKKALIIIGGFVSFLIVWATTFKLMHWPGAGPLFVLGMLFFCMVFLPLFFIQRMISNRSGLNIVTNIFALISSFSIFMGVLFKIMHWLGAGPLILLGTLFLAIPTLILYIVQQFKEYDRKFREFWRTVILCILTSVFLIFWGLNVTGNILYSFLNVEDATLETNKNLMEVNAYILADIAAADSNQVQKQIAENIAHQSDEMIMYIDKIKHIVIDHVGHDPEGYENHWYINAKDNYDIPTYILCSEDGVGKELFDQLTSFNTSLQNEMKTISGKTDDLGNFTGLNPEMMEFSDNWQDAMFYQKPVVSSLAILTGIQTKVLNAEFKCLKTIKMSGK